MSKALSLAGQAVDDKKAAFAAFFAPAHESNFLPSTSGRAVLTDAIAPPQAAHRDECRDSFLLPSHSRATAALWRKIVAEVAAALWCSTEDRRFLLAQLHQQDPSYLRTVLQMAQAHQIPLIQSFEFWELVRPDLLWLRVVDTRSGVACFMSLGALPAGAAEDGRDLYHGATVTLSVVSSSEI